MGDLLVVVVVDLGDVFAWCRAGNSSGALDEQPVEGDRRGQEQGVECGSVEALADKRGSADDHNAVAGLGVGQVVLVAGEGYAVWRLGRPARAGGWPVQLPGGGGLSPGGNRRNEGVGDVLVLTVAGGSDTNPRSGSPS